ncbi:hypothetical protein Cni_G23875 [Canna indica]|uniref:Uncharacterized protein n=1 Tax=Canna indica TaxID=4628 RepID=A0AAQ3KUU3_9LILI|nr:hypothetical protein Cni_G23875 [Canna indica]
MLGEKGDTGENGNPGSSGKKPPDPGLTAQPPRWADFPSRWKYGIKAVVKKYVGSLDRSKGIKPPSSDPIKFPPKDHLQKQSRDSTSDADRSKMNNLGSRAALFKEAISFSSGDSSKSAESKIKAIQEGSSDEVVIEDYLPEIARMNWVNCLYACK